MSKDLTVLMAAFDDRQLVENEWTAMRQMIRSGEIDLDDAAVVENLDNKVGVVHNLHHPVRRGALVGALLVVLGPVGLVAGAAGGAIGGKAADIMRNGLSTQTLTELGEFLGTNQFMIVVTGTMPMVRAVADTLPEASRRIIHLVTDDADHLRVEVVAADT